MTNILNNTLVRQFNDIETILLNCYSNEPRKVLIKSSKSTKQNLIDDGNSILKCLQITNPVLKMAIKIVDKHSELYGDNCKILFVYVCEFLRFLNTNKHVCDLIRQLNLNEFDSKLRFWFNQDNQNTMIYHQELELNVFNDLKFTPTINKILKDHLTNMLKVYNQDYYKILRDFEHILINNLTQNQFDRKSFEESKLYAHGFLVSKKFESKIKAFKAVIMINDKTSNEEVIVNNIKETSLHMFNSHFNDEFIKILKNFGVNLILTSNGFNDYQKTQLRIINCEFIPFIDEEYLKFLSLKLKCKFISEANWFEFIGDQEKYLIQIENTQLINESCMFFELDKNFILKCDPLAFIYLNLPMSGIFNHIKSYYLKVLKVLRLLEQDTRLIVSFKFESIMTDIFKKHKNDEICLNLVKIFERLDRKLNRDTHQKDTYELLELKLRLLNECLCFIKQIISIDKIVKIKSK